MRTLKVLSTLLFATLMLVACGTDKDSCTGTALDFHKVLCKLNFEAAKQYSTGELTTMLDTMGTMASLTDEEKDSIEKLANEATYEVVGVEMNEENTSARVTIQTQSNGKVKEDSYSLVKLNDEWKVSQIESPYR